VKPLLILAIAIAASVCEARDQPTTCSSYTNITGTTTTDCRTPDRKPTHCTSYTNINGVAKTECR
jgi:hypothetical protein